MITEKIKIWIIFLLFIGFFTYTLFIYVNLPVERNMKLGNSSTLEGKWIWQKYNCNSCHQLYGLGGYLGPDLTNVYSKRGELYISVFLRNGNAIMPDFKLTEEEIVFLLAFLENADLSGNADPRHFKIKINGTIE